MDAGGRHVPLFDIIKFISEMQSFVCTQQWWNLFHLSSYVFITLGFLNVTLFTIHWNVKESHPQTGPNNTYGCLLAGSLEMHNSSFSGM